MTERTIEVSEPVEVTVATCDECGLEVSEENGETFEAADDEMEDLHFHYECLEGEALPPAVELPPRTIIEASELDIRWALDRGDIGLIVVGTAAITTGVIGLAALTFAGSPLLGGIVASILTGVGLLVFQGGRSWGQKQARRTLEELAEQQKSLVPGSGGPR